MLSLAVGRYEVRAEKTGFKTAVQTGINLSAEQQAVVNLRLEIGAVQEQVTVTSDAPLVNTTTESMSGLVGEKQVKELPINGRSWDLLIALNASTINFTSVLKQGAGNVGGNLFSVDGRRPSENLTLMNGIEYTGSGNAAVSPAGAAGQLLGIDGVREYNVVADNYGVEYGKRAGAQINAVTQSGTNQIHGSVFEFLRNSDLDARNFFDYPKIAPLERNQFGGALGGPIRKDKTFIFGNYEGFRENLGTTSVIFVPDLNLRQGLLPCGGAVTAFPSCGAGAAVGTPTKVSNIDPNALQLMDLLYPVPNGPSLGGGVAQFSSNPTQKQRQDFGTTRFDQRFSDKDSFSANYMIDDGDVVSPSANLVSVGTAAIRNQIASLQETHIFSPTVINSFTAGFSRILNDSSTATVVSFPSNLDFVVGEVPGTVAIGSAGNVNNSTSLTSVNGGSAQPTIFNRNLFTYSDGLQIVRGKHQISVGAWFQRVQANEYDPLKSSGQATFTNILSLLQGQVSDYSITQITTEMGWRSWLGAWYVQDSIQLRPNLTLRIGLRHEFSNGWSEHTGRAGTVLFTNGVIQTAPRLSDELLLNNNSLLLFSPRLGLAWDPFGKGKTSIRAGFGTYYDMVDTLSYFADVTAPLAGSADITNVTLEQAIPLNRNSPIKPQCGPGIATTQCNTYSQKSDDPNLKVPTVETWNLSLEQQLTKQTALRVAYVGSEAFHLFFNTDDNSIPSQICQNAAGCLAGGVNVSSKNPASTVPQGTMYIPAMCSSCRPNPYLTYGLFLYTQGTQSYNGLQTELVQRITRGLQFRANYTWSHNIDTGSAVIGTVARDDSPHYATVENISNRGSAAFDVRQAFHTNFSYALPFGQSAHGLADKLVGGWQLNGNMTFLTGFPITALAGSNQSGSGDLNNPDRANVVPGIPIQSGMTAGCGSASTGVPAGPLGTPNRWYNPCAFSFPTLGTFGNAGRGSITGPGVTSVDFSLFKNTHITERVNLQFRGEVFNILNHANFGIPIFNTFSGGTYNPQAGVISFTSTTSRQMQFGLKVIF